MSRAVVAAVLLAAAVLAQLAIVNAVAPPGGAAPDLVLLAVISLGLSCGPATGMTAGFCAGLALDLAPPASELAGLYALVFCLAGYCCGRLRRVRGGSRLAAVLVGAATAAVAELAIAGLSLVLDAPAASWAVVSHRLPVAMAADAALSPVFVLAVLAGTAWLGVAAPAASDSPAGELAGSAGPTVGGRPAGGRWRPGWAAASENRAVAIAAARLRHPSSRGRPGRMAGQPSSWHTPRVQLRLAAIPPQRRRRTAIPPQRRRRIAVAPRSGLRSANPGSAAASRLRQGAVAQRSARSAVSRIGAQRSARSAVSRIGAQRSAGSAVSRLGLRSHAGRQLASARLPSGAAPRFRSVPRPAGEAGRSAQPRLLSGAAPRFRALARPVRSGTLRRKVPAQALSSHAPRFAGARAAGASRAGTARPLAVRRSRPATGIARWWRRRRTAAARPTRRGSWR